MYVGKSLLFTMRTPKHIRRERIHPFRMLVAGLSNFFYSTHFYIQKGVGDGIRLHFLPLAENNGSAASSRSRQRSSALHLIFRIPSPP
jgi:hypothetical protein